MSVPHRLRFSLEQRQTESVRIMQRFPGRIPIIIEKSSRATDIPNLPRNRFLAPADMTVGQFIYVIRKSISLAPEKALFIFVGNSLPTTGMTVRELYSDHRHEDGFLYVTYSGESTFGVGGGNGDYSSRDYSSLNSTSSQRQQKKSDRLHEGRGGSSGGSLSAYSGFICILNVNPTTKSNGCPQPGT